MSTKRQPRVSDVAAGVIAYLALHFLLEVAFPSRFKDANTHPEGFLLAAAIDGLVMASVALYFILRAYSEPLSSFGFSLRRLPFFALVGTGVGIALSAVAIGYGQILGSLVSYSENPYVGLLTGSKSVAVRAFVVVIVVGAAPIAEEIFFRAFVFSVVRLVSSMKLALVMSSTLFALAHFSVDWFVLNCFSGVILAVLIRKTGSLTAPIAAHMAFNAIGLAGSIFLGETVEELSWKRN